MIFHETPLKNARLIDLEKRGDERGFFARVFCGTEFENAGLNTRFVQINNSLSGRKGTLRGMHYQLAPSADHGLPVGSATTARIVTATTPRMMPTT